MPRARGWVGTLLGKQECELGRGDAGEGEREVRTCTESGWKAEAGEEEGWFWSGRVPRKRSSASTWTEEIGEHVIDRG